MSAKESYTPLKDAACLDKESSTDLECSELDSDVESGQNHTTRDSFWRALKLAFQVACWVTLYATITQHAERVMGGADENKSGKFHETLRKSGFGPEKWLKAVLFTVDSDFGSTAKNVFYGSIGVLCAWSAQWSFLGIAGAGYQAQDDDHVWWCGMAFVVIYTFAFMFLQVNDSTRFWALINFTGDFAMNILNPTYSQQNLSTRFGLSISTYAEQATLVYFLGAVLALLIWLIPWTSSLDMSREAVGKVVVGTSDLLQKLHQYYCGPQYTLESFYLQGDFRQFKAQLAQSKTYGENAWFESFGRRSTARKMHIRLIELLERLMLNAEPMLELVAEEDFGKTHIQVMQKSLQEPLHSVMNTTWNLVGELYHATQIGELGRQEEINQKRELMLQQVKIVQDNMDWACIHLSLHGEKKIPRDLIGERYYAMSICRMAQLVEEACGCDAFLGDNVGNSNEQDGKKDQNAVESACSSLFKHGDGDLRWACRATATLLLSFVLGYFGWSLSCQQISEKYSSNYTELVAKTNDTSHALAEMGYSPQCFIRQHSAAITCTVVALMNRYSGGSLDGAQKRIAAVTFAMVLGQTGYVLLGYDTFVHEILSMIVIFFVTWCMMYLKYDGGNVTATIAQRLAAFTVAALVQERSNEALKAEQYAGEYRQITDMVVAAVLLSLFDVLLADESPAERCIKVLDEVVENFHALLHDFFHNDSPQPAEDVQSRVSDLQLQLKDAREACESATKAHSLWRQPFNAPLVELVIAEYDILCSQMYKLSRVLGNDRVEIVDRLPRFFSIVRPEIQDMSERTRSIVRLTIKGHDEEQLERKLQEEVAADASENAVSMLVEDMNDRPFEKCDAGNQHKLQLTPTGRRCALASLLQSMLKGMHGLQKKVVQKTSAGSD